MRVASVNIIFAGILLVAASCVRAQDLPDMEGSSERQPVLSSGEEILLVGIPVLATVGGAVLGVGASIWADSPLPLLIVPTFSATAACTVGALADLGGSCGRAFRAATLASLPGYALIAIGALADGWDALGFILAGALELVVVSPFAAADGYRLSIPVDVTPIGLESPDGRAVGFQMHIGL